MQYACWNILVVYNILLKRRKDATEMENYVQSVSLNLTQIQFKNALDLGKVCWNWQYFDDKFFEIYSIGLVCVKMKFESTTEENIYLHTLGLLAIFSFFQTLKSYVLYMSATNSFFYAFPNTYFMKMVKQYV